jgi:hypothetical protein
MKKATDMSSNTIAKAKTPPGPEARAAALVLAAGPWLTPPWTLEEGLRRIEAMGQQVDGYVQFMCKAGSLTGTSPEAKERAVMAFYERLVVVERQLRKIREDLELG